MLDVKNIRFGGQIPTDKDQSDMEGDASDNDRAFLKFLQLGDSAG